MRTDLWIGGHRREASDDARFNVENKAYELMVRDGEIPARLIARESGKGLADARGEFAYVETQYISADW